MLRLASAYLLGANGAASNMNGDYVVASGGKFGVPFNSDFGSKGHEYFDVWAPEIATHYGEVFWTDQGATPIPPEIVERFKGKVMAITGYEQDQVMVTPTGKPGVNPSEDVSVPINWAYNHHYMAWMTGAHSELKTVPVSGEARYADPMAHGAETKKMAFDKPSAAFRSDQSIPTSQMFSEGNGGESRKSFHGYPNGFAQLIESPETWHITPMQIDTRNRDCGATKHDVKNCSGPTGFIPGPEPKQTRFGRGVPKDTVYSGVLECPCNSRYGGDLMFYPDAKTKVIKHKYTADDSSDCVPGQTVADASACFAVAPTLGINATSWINKTVSDAKLPPACSVIKNADGSATAYFNSAGAGTCKDGAKTTGDAASGVGVKLALELDANTAGGVAKITASGPADVWFGIGFNASVMADSPYTFVINASGVIEQKIGTCGSEAEHCPGDQLATSVKVVSNTVAGGVRTVVMTRAFKGATSKHYTFDPKNPSIPLLTAVGATPVFAYHKSHDNTLMTLTSTGSSTCICDSGAIGQLCEAGGQGCRAFTKGCVGPNVALNYTGASAGDLLRQRNPTCNSLQYGGGLTCCGHKRIMLDADQEVRPELLQYHMKFRFWFQEYINETKTGKPSHADLPRVYQQTEANAGEYDIPPAFALPGQPIPGYGHWPVNKTTPGTTCTGTCPDGPDCECVHTITYHWTISNTRLIYAGGHCHAPACLSIELYENSTGTPKILCRQLPKYGLGNVSHDKYDEIGYLALPPCLWSDTGGEGLEPAVFLGPNTPVFSVKKNRNTHTGHYGEMASWQMRGVNFPASAPSTFV